MGDDGKRTAPAAPWVAWLPPAMPDDEKAGFAAAYPADPHRAAAEAWEAWAAAGAGEDTPAGGAGGLAGARSVTTGAQSVTYGPRGAGAVASALERAAWHRARARVVSREVAPRYRRTDDDRGVWAGPGGHHGHGGGTSGGAGGEPGAWPGQKGDKGDPGPKGDPGDSWVPSPTLADPGDVLTVADGAAVWAAPPAADVGQLAARVGTLEADLVDVDAAADAATAAATDAATTATDAATEAAAATAAAADAAEAAAEAATAAQDAATAAAAADGRARAAEAAAADVAADLADNTRQDETWRATATDAFASVAAQADDTADLLGQTLGDPAGTAPPEWTPTAWPEGSLVVHLGGVWLARQAAQAEHVPGSSARWESVAVPDLADRVNNVRRDVDALAALVPPLPASPVGRALVVDVTGHPAWLAPASATLDGLADVTAPPSTPAGVVLGTTATGVWGPVTPPTTDLQPITTRVATVEQTIARLELDDLADVTAPTSTPAGKMLATTDAGAWGVVDLPEGLPPTALPAPYTHKTGGAQGPGQATLMNGIYVIAHNTDTAGVAHAWQAALVPGDPFVFGPAGSPWSGTVGSVNTAEGGIPQQLVDTFVASGMTLVHPATGFPPTPADGAAVVFGGSDTGKVLTVGDAGPGWEPVLLPPPAAVPLDGLADVSAPDTTPAGMMLGTTAVGSWGPVDGWHRWTGTQAQYDALPVKDPATLYVVTG